MKGLILTGVLVFGTAGAASAADLGGSWIIKADFSGKAHYTFVCTMKSDGKTLDGPCVAVQRVLNTSGSLDAQRMRLKYSSDYNGSGLEQEYSGQMKADGGVNGTVKNRLGDGSFGGAPLTSDGTLNPQAWHFKVGFSDDIKFDLFCSLKSDGGRLHGPCGVGDGAVLQTHGELDGANVNFGYDTELDGKPLHAAYTGTVQGDVMKGTIKAGDSAGTFTARRA